MKINLLDDCIEGNEEKIDQEYNEKEEVILDLGFIPREEAIQRGILFSKNEDTGYVRKLHNGALHILPVDYINNKTIDEIYYNFYEDNREINDI